MNNCMKQDKHPQISNNNWGLALPNASSQAKTDSYRTKVSQHQGMVINEEP